MNKSRKGRMRTVLISDICPKSANRGIVVRPPTDDEIRQAATNPSDYQMGRIRYFSKLLCDFELLNDIYKSKKAVIEKSNKVKVSKILDQLEKIMNFYDYKDNIDVFNKDITQTTMNLHSQFEINIPVVLYNVKKWSDIVEINPKLGYSEEMMIRLGTILRDIYGSDRDVIQRQYNNQINSIFSESSEHRRATEITGLKSYEPTQEEIDRMKRIYKNLMNHFTSLYKEKRFDSPKDYIEFIAIADKVNAILNEDIMKHFVAPETIKNVGEYYDAMVNYLSTIKCDGTRTHTMTVIIDIATTNLKELNETMVNLGYVDGICNIDNYFDYIKTYRPGMVDKICNTYNIAPDEMNGNVFKDYESFMKYLYSPERIRKIDSEVYKVKRSRKSNTLRKGAELAVDYAINKKRQNTVINRASNNFKRGRRARTIDELNQLLENKVKERNLMKERLIVLCTSSNEYITLKANETKIGKDIAALKNTIKKRMINGDIEVKTDAEKLEELKEEENSILQKVKERINYSYEMEDLKDEFNYSENNIKGDDAIIAGDMFTFSFVMLTKNNEICAAAVDKLVEVFNPDNSKYYNIDYYDTDPSEFGTNYAKEIIIDYPRKSPMFKMFSQKPETANHIISLMRANISEKFGINPAIVDDSDYIKINEPFPAINLF